MLNWTSHLFTFSCVFIGLIFVLAGFFFVFLFLVCYFFFECCPCYCWSVWFKFYNFLLTIEVSMDTPPPQNPPRSLFSCFSVPWMSLVVDVFLGCFYTEYKHKFIKRRKKWFSFALTCLCASVLYSSENGRAKVQLLKSNTVHIIFSSKKPLL